MCSIEIVKLLESFRKSFNTLKDYKITLKDRPFIIGKISHIEEGQAGETFYDPYVNNSWDSELDMVLKLYVLTPTNPNPVEIGWRDIVNIEFYERSDLPIR